MAVILLSLMVILSSVEGYRQPFTAFRSHQVDHVHGLGHGLQPGSYKPIVRKVVVAQPSYPRYTPKAIVSQPSYPRYTPKAVVSQPSYPKYTSPYQGSANVRFQPASQSFASNQGFQRQSNANFRTASNKFTSGNLVQQAKAQAESTLEILKSFEGSSLAAQYIDPIFETSDCLNSLEDVTALIEEGTNLIVSNGPEIIYLEAIVDNLKNEKDVGKLIKASSKMLRTLDELIPNLSASSSNLCITTPEASVKAFRDLAHAMEDIMNNRNLNVPVSSRKQLEFSSNVMSETADFIETLNKALATYETLCENDNKNHAALYDSIREIMTSLGELFDVLGFADKSAEIKKQGEFIKKIVEVFEDLEDLDTELECGFGGSYKGLAQTLDDLAEIVDSVGIEKLSKELGLDLDFVNSV